MKNIIIFIAVLFSLSINAQQRNLKVESNHSTVGFSISIAGFTNVTGKFTDYEISLDWNDDDITSSKINSVIQVASINTGIPDRDEHLQSSDFFNVEEFPTITFHSDSIQRVNFSHFNAFGKLSMHGVTKNVILPFEIVKMDGNTIGIRCHTTLSRSEYGVGIDFIHTSIPDFLSDEIKVEIDFWTKKRKT